MDQYSLNQALLREIEPHRVLWDENYEFYRKQSLAPLVTKSVTIILKLRDFKTEDNLIYIK